MSGIWRIAAERRRQLDEEGWTAEHDDDHSSGEMAMAAALYADPTDELVLAEYCSAGNHVIDVRDPWPWLDRVEPPRGGPLISITVWDKRQQHPRMRRLEIAGALIAAEIDRLERAA